MIEPRIFT